MAAEGGRVQISFPQHAAALLDSLNRLRLEGKFCDVAVHVGGRIFPAHKSVLAAASPFFHDKLLLQDGGRLLLPPAIDPDAFEGLLHLIYSGRLTLLLEALPGHLLVASGLQMWHVVDQCSEILRELEGGTCRWAGRGSEGTSSSSSSRGGEASSSWTTRGGDGSSCVTHGGDGSSSSSWTTRGGDGSSCATHGGDGASSWTTRGDGSSCTTHGGDGGSSWTTRGGDGPSCPTRGGDGTSSWATRGGDGSSASSSWPVRGGDSSSCPTRGGDGTSLWASRGGDGSSASSSWPMRGGDGSSWATRGGEVATPSFTKEGGEEVLKIRVAADVAPAATSSLSSLLKDAGEEVLKICVEEDEEEEEEEEEGGHRRRHRPTDALQIVLEEEEEEDGVPGAPHEPPKIFYIKQEVGDATTVEGLLPASELAGGFAPAEVSYVIPAGGSGTTVTTGSAMMTTGGASVFPQPSWKPVDLHGNEILGRGQALHAPVKLGAAPDGKRFGCLCGKRFAVKPKRDRHIMLTFSLRPFACAACHKRFKLKHHLTEHMKTHDGAGRACERCGRHFRLRSGLAKHRPLCQGARWGGGCWACE
ncbi:zinc finger and BTB domain-containing protein 9 [Falco rusticolus]|uniref:zinc finger and BTB domain-containing protein 9 n=1 Tax=Falco rusticolus TaxID=120794 RepID=UPI001886A3EE|nr:zinc finger and BTB domain-containing protein 9 [Falco rusticolus]